MVDILQESWLTIGHENEYISLTWPGTVTSGGSIAPAIVTPWYRNGNLLEYALLCPSMNRLDIVYQVASALAYIHSKGVVHGNVCPGNVCIADDGTVRMTDIGVDTHIRQTNKRYRHSVPTNWMYKPCEELEHGHRTTQTDTYSFSTTIYSMYTLRPPFSSHSYGRGLMWIVHQGHDGIFGNSKPAEISDKLWEIVRMCWTMDASQRPSMSEVEQKLGRMH